MKEQQDPEFMKSGAYFTYTPSLAWAWKPHAAGLGKEEEDVEHLSRLGTGHLGDEVLVSIGVDDVGRAFVKVKVDFLPLCMRLCPGVKVAVKMKED